MGRKKKIKTFEEQINYNERRRTQNKLNQENFRLRNKLLKKVEDTTPLIKNYEYKENLKQYLKKNNFNYFLTLTTKNVLTTKYLTILIGSFFNNLKSKLNIERVFYVIEIKNQYPHIHMLIKTDTNTKFLSQTIKDYWDEGFTYLVKIYSEKEDYNLENYILKEVNYNSQEINWWIK